MDTTGEGGGEKERRFSVNICTQPNHVNNVNKTLYNVNSLGGNRLCDSLEFVTAEEWKTRPK